MSILSSRPPLALLVLSIILLTLLACASDTTTSPDTPATDTPTGDTPAQDASQAGLDDYLALCLEPASEVTEEVDEIPFDELSVSFGDSIARLESVEPPAGLADWHAAMLAYQRAVKKAFDDAPASASQDEYILTTLFPIALQYQPSIDAAISTMDPDLLTRMIEAGCIDEESVEGSASFEGAQQIDTTSLSVGDSMQFAADNPDAASRYSFDAEQGQRYLIEIASNDLPDFVVTRPVPQSQFPQSFIFSDGEQNLTLRWESSTSDTHFLQITPNGIGSYTLTVSLDLTPLGPSNVHYSWEGSEIRINWDPVQTAEYYKVYHEDFFETGCSVNLSGTPEWCKVLAPRVVDTTYLHSSPDRDKNFYWVAACNSAGCSRTPSDDPAPLVGDVPPGPADGGPCQAGVTLEEGDSCTVAVPGLQGATNVFQVRNGEGCYGNICAGDTLNLNGFIASANPNSSWLVTRIPGSAPSLTTPPPPATTPAPPPTPRPTATPAPPPTPRPTATPILPSTPRPTATPAPAATAEPITNIPSAPTNVLYAWEGASIRVTWDPVSGAEYYRLLYSDFFDSSCRIGHDGMPSFCDELDAALTDSTYLHATPAFENNYYWVIACDSDGCSEVDSENPASPEAAKPSAPSNATYVHEGSEVLVSWDPFDGADYYKVYHDDFFDSACSVGRDGSPRFCEELAANVTGTTYRHTDPGDDENHYWIVACGRGGCSDVDSENPAQEDTA